MVSSRIPGPQAIDDPLEEADRRTWPHSLGRTHQYHRPGPLGVHREPSWLRGICLAPIHHIDCAEVLKDLKRWEGDVPFMYLDSKGLVTVGIGNLLRTVEPAKLLPFVNASTGNRATEADIVTAYNAVSAMPPKLGWRRYKLNPSIELTPETSRQLALSRLESEFLPALRRAYPEFDYYPTSAHRFMIDMAYNGGVRFLAKRHMDGPIGGHNWLAAVSLVPTEGDPRRNAWRVTMLRQAALEDAL
jgi:GH24 family phage-related lysozyme (muramidase)